MATSSQAQAVKSLNKAPGRRRFVFKSFSQRLEEVEIDVFRSLDKVKSEPLEGSTFFRDCLVEWRELNTAEDFISFYEQMTPLVQTLPLVLLHKETIVSELVLRLQTKARLSLEPILRLIAALSRDLLEDFIPFLPRIADSLVSLLESGADRETEIIEQIFTSWSSIMMYLQKYLVQKIVHVLKVTVKLRYYPKDYIQEFMAEVMSFLLRNAPFEQLKEGVKKIMFEVVKKSVPIRKFGVSALLYYVMRGTSSRFHSRAEQVLHLLMDNLILGIGEPFSQGSDTVVDVLVSALERLSEDLDSKELNLMFKCLYQEITECVSNGSLERLSRLLLLLVSTVEVKNGKKVSDYQQMIEIVGLLMRTFIMPSGITMAEEHSSEVVEKVLQLMICILSGLHSYNDVSTISSCSLQWAPVFDLKNPSLLGFIRQLLQKDVCVVSIFRVNILRALNDLIETSREDVIYLLLNFCEKLQTEMQCLSFLDGTPEGVSRIQCFLRGDTSNWVGVLKGIVNADSSSTLIHEADLALLWGIINCFPHIVNSKEDLSLLMDLIDAIDQILMFEADNIAGLPKHTWESLIGATLNSYYKLTHGKKSELDQTSRFLHLGKRHKSCSQVLVAVADFLDSMYGPMMEGDNKKSRTYHPELQADTAVDALDIFADNLCHPDRGIRSSTLRILCHFETINCNNLTEDEPVAKKIRREVSPTCHVDNQGFNVLQLLLSIESTPLSISTSRKVTLLISRIQMGLSSGRIAEAYLALVLNGMIGIFHNRFSYLWNPASECLAVLISHSTGLVWERFVTYFELCQSRFQASFDQVDKVNSQLFNKTSDLVERFNLFITSTSDSTPSSAVLSSLLQSLQGIPTIIESKSRQILPLFLKFLGYTCKDFKSIGSFNPSVCKGKEWKGVLKEWLNLLKLMHNLRSFYQNQFLKEVLQNRLLDENDAEIQMMVLDCLLIWKDDFLLPYSLQLKSLASFHNLREVLTTWSVSRESNLIDEQHRAYLVPMVIRLLMPKVRKLNKHGSQKHSRVNNRKAVLGFIAQLDVEELPLFFALLLKPLQIISVGSDGAANWFWTVSNGSVEEFRALNFLNYFTFSNIAALSWKKRSGFLHVIEDILGVFDALRLGPFLDFLMGCVVRILGSCTSSLDVAKGNGSSSVEHYPNANLTLLGKESVLENNVVISPALRQFKDLRSLCLKIVSFVLNKYEDHDFSSEFWDLFFVSVKPLIDGFKQEGASGQKPSSLFSCFLALSRSEKLVPLLCREQKLVPDMLSILTVTSASEAIVSCVLKFVENLLTLDHELGDEDSAVKKVILSNLEALIDSLHFLFQSNNAAKRKLLKHPGETETKIFKFLPKYIKGALPARKFVDILLPVLANGAQNSEFCFEAVQVIRDIVPVLGREITSKILHAVSPLLTSTDLDKRVFICDLLEALSRADPSLHFVAKLVQDLNATSITEMGSLDYDKVVNTYESISVDIFYTIREDHALVILSHCVYDMSSEELILRHSAYKSLVSFVEFAALILGRVVSDHCKMSDMPDKMSASDDRYWTKTCIQRITSKFLLKHMGNALKRGTSVRKEWVDLLREMVSKLPEVANLGSLKSLCDEDAEIDFFNNIVHLQKHRRARALARFRDVTSASYMPEGITKKVFVPLFFNMLLEEHEGKGEHVKNVCIEALASICIHMEWNSYYSLLMRCFNEMIKNPNKQKLLLRLICSILDQFHFSDAKDSLDKVSNTKTHTTDTGSSILRKCSSSVTVNEIQTCLQKVVLPKIQKLLSDSEKVNANISLAALRVLRLLPGDVMDSQLPSIVHRISNFLKNRLESIREEARSALAACLKLLGLEYLHFIVKVLRATLKRGYELHVLGYTLNFILSKFLVTPISGKLDYCLEDLLYVVQNDILGDVAEEKDIEKIASKMKETKKQKSFETLKLIAQSVTFKSHALKLLSPVTAQFEKQLTPKTKTKLESMLTHIAAGIECNPTVDQTDLFIFVHGLIEDGIKEENDQGENLFIKRVNGRRRNNMTGKAVSSSSVVGAKSVCSHLISVFALGILQKRMKNVKLGKSDAQMLSMLDPFVLLLGKCLNSKYEDVVSASLRCLTPLVRLPLPAIESQADNIKSALFGIAESSINTGSSLMQSCLRLLTVLLRGTKITLSSDQLHMLIQLPLFVDLERNPSFVALSLLKAIVNRKLVVPEIYDLVTRVSELMVTSQVEPIRHKCSKIFLQFLLDYQLSGKRLQQHLDSLLSNLRYEHSSGRKAALDMLHTIIVKFPDGVVDEQSQTFFVHLVVCLSNDQDNEVRSLAGAAIKCLTGYISPHSFRFILEYSLSWYLGEKQKLWSAAAQVLGLLVEVMERGNKHVNRILPVEVMEKEFHKHISRILPVTKSFLQSAISTVMDRQLDFSNETSIPLWKEAYYSLVMLEKMLHQFHGLCFEPDLEDIWAAICELLLHPHMWLRCISSRLVAFYFAAVTTACSKYHEKPFGTYYLIRPSRVFMIAVYHCCQMKTQLIDDAASNLITQNLVSTVLGVHSLMGQTGCDDSHQFASTLEQHEQDHFLKAFELLEAKKGRSMFLSLTSGKCGKNDESPSKNIRFLLVSNLLKRMGKIALQMEAIQMKIVFESFGKISSELSQEDCLLYAYEILLPLYKVCEGFSGRVIPENVKQLAQEVCERIRNKLGIQKFVLVYSDIRRNLKAKRDKRKNEEKRMAVVDPMRNAKRKLRNAEKHRANKKRKMVAMKMGRWMHSSKSK